MKSRKIIVSIEKMAMARQWMKFFLDAGIPKDTSAEYALEFESNRMEMNLLGELDKDCLR